MKTITWLFWKVYYLFTPRPHNARTCITKLFRTRSPWWKFKPYIYRCEALSRWEVWFNRDERTISRLVKMNVWAEMTKDGRILGLHINDEDLKLEISS